MKNATLTILLILLLISLGINIYQYTNPIEKTVYIENENQESKNINENTSLETNLDELEAKFYRNEIDGDFKFHTNIPETTTNYNNNPDLPQKYEQLTYPFTQVNVPFSEKNLHRVGLLVYMPYTVVDDFVFIQDYRVYQECPKDEKCVSGIISSSSEPGDGLALAPYNRNIISFSQQDVEIAPELDMSIFEREQRGKFSKYPIVNWGGRLTVIDN